MADVAIIGAGSWGIALAKVLHTNGNKVTVWSIVEDEITMLKENMSMRRNFRGKTAGRYGIYDRSGICGFR